MSVIAFWSSFAGKSSPSAIIDPPSRRSLASLSLTSSGCFAPARRPPAIGIFNPPSLRIQAIAGEIPHETETIDAESINIHLKRGLIDLIAGTSRGMTATSETRAEVSELISQLEAGNPNPAPTEALNLLDGKWIVAYASSAGFWPAAAMAAGRLPQVVKVDEISVTIDSEASTVRNSVRFVGPFSSTSVTANAKFQVRSPKRVHIMYVEGIIGSPQYTDHPSISFPEKLEFFGRSIDLSPFNGALSSLQGTAASVAKAVSSLPQVTVPIPASKAESWLLTTYLDDDLRISRGDCSSLFVLIKEGSPLLGQLKSH